VADTVHECSARSLEFIMFIARGMVRLNPLSSLERPPKSQPHRERGRRDSPPPNSRQCMVCFLSHARPPLTFMHKTFGYKQKNKFSAYNNVQKHAFSRSKNLKFFFGGGTLPQWDRGGSPSDTTCRVPRFDRLYGTRPPSCF